MKTIVLTIFFTISFLHVKAQEDINRAVEKIFSTKLLSTKIPIISATINGKSAYFLLDTGSTMSMIDISRKKKYDFKTLKRLSKKLNGFGGNQLDVFSIFDYNILIDGERIISDFVGISLEQVRMEVKKRTGYEIAGIIGSNTMENYGIVLDYYEEQCYLKYQGY